MAAAGRAEQDHLAVRGRHLGALKRRPRGAGGLDHHLRPPPPGQLLDGLHRVCGRRIHQQFDAALLRDVQPPGDPVQSDHPRPLSQKELSGEVADQALAQHDGAVAQLRRRGAQRGHGDRGDQRPDGIPRVTAGGHLAPRPVRVHDPVCGVADRRQHHVAQAILGHLASDGHHLARRRVAELLGEVEPGRFFSRKAVELGARADR